VPHPEENNMVTEINSKQDMSAFARAHESGPITWIAVAGPGGTIILIDKA
jgi:hypothetical protein